MHEGDEAMLPYNFVVIFYCKSARWMRKQNSILYIAQKMIGWVVRTSEVIYTTI
jgi:hypothetical protein